MIQYVSASVLQCGSASIQLFIKTLRCLIAVLSITSFVNKKKFKHDGYKQMSIAQHSMGLYGRTIKAIEALKGRLPVAVIEGDQQTSNDAERIRATGAPAIQINTGKGCHLDAHMVGHALETLNPPSRRGCCSSRMSATSSARPLSILARRARVVVLSVTEGEDKPLKYPDMFAAADLMLLNKADLLPHLDFDVGLVSPTRSGSTRTCRR